MTNDVGWSGRGCRRIGNHRQAPRNRLLPCREDFRGPQGHGVAVQLATGHVTAVALPRNAIARRLTAAAMVSCTILCNLQSWKNRNMGKTTRIIVLGLLLFSAGCATVRPTIREHVPRGSDIAVIMFRDCTISGQEDCGGSGLSAGSVFARVFSEDFIVRAMPLSRPVPAAESLDDNAAAAYGRAKGFRYVVNGEVEDYYRVAPMTFRPERAGVSVRLLDTSNGQVMAFFSDRGTAPNFSTPDAILGKFAKTFRQSITE